MARIDDGKIHELTGCGRKSQPLMNKVDSVRRFCLSFPQAKENLQWGETLCFKVRGKIFAMLRLDSVPPQLIVKCTRERFAELLELEGIRPAPYVGRYSWVLLERLEALPESELEELVQQSYELVAAKSKTSPRNRSGRTRPKARPQKTRRG